MAKKAPFSRRMTSVLVPALALLALLGITAFAILGPTGVLAWSDNKAALAAREKQLHALKEKRDALKNRVRLLDPENVDPDLGGELIRKELGVAAPDEVVVPLTDAQ